jgi:hypothetical protein
MSQDVASATIRYRLIQTDPETACKNYMRGCVQVTKVHPENYSTDAGDNMLLQHGK